MKVFSDGMTAHRYSFTLDVLKTSEDTILGKPLLWAYSIWTDDATTHEKSEVPCGFIPENKTNANITYKYDKKLKKTFMYVDCYIWSVYAEKLVQIFSRTDGLKDVSTELWIISSKDHPKEKYQEVLEFTYNGVTILGEVVSPACPGASIQTVNFSVDEFSLAKKSFELELNNADAKERECSFFDAKNDVKEDLVLVNEEFKNSEIEETPEVLENGTAIVRTSVSISQDTDVYDDDGKFLGNESEAHYKSTVIHQETSDTTEDNDNAEDIPVTENSDTTIVNEEAEDMGVLESTENSDEENFESKYMKLEADFSLLQNELVNLKNTHEALLLKCSVLEDYKKNKDDENKKRVIECALNDVSSTLNASEISSWREKSLNYENVDLFKNELKAFAFDLQKQRGVQTPESIRNSIPNQNLTISGATGIWDRLEQQIQ